MAESGAAGSERRAHARTVAEYDVLLLAVVIVVSRADMFVHEVLGHAVPAALCGAKLSYVDITLFGGGQAHYFFPLGVSPRAHAFCYAGGSLANVVTGAIALAFVKRVKNHVAALSLALFGLAGLATSFSYIAKGLYYGSGDAARVVGELYGSAAEAALERGDGHLWIAFAIGLPIVTAIGMRVYLPLQERFFPTKTKMARFRVAALTIGVVAAVYTTLLVGTDRFVATQDPARLTTDWRDAREHSVRRAKFEARLAAMHAERPDVSDEVLVKQLFADLKKNPLVVAPGEVPRTIPLGIVLPILSVLAGAWAITRQRGRSGTADAVSPRAIGVTCAAAAALLFTLFALGQRIPL